MVTISFSDDFQMLFTHSRKNESLRTYLLMEQQFKKLLQKTKAQKEQKDPLFKSFEGALFQDSAWFFNFQDTIIPLIEREISPLKVENVPVVVTESATKSGLVPLSEVLFVGDTFSGDGDDLLGKMIAAMKLTGAEFYRHPMDEVLDDIVDLAKNLETPDSATQKLFEIILEKRPKVVVTLGATVTNILLGKREKLSTIHGQFFEKQQGECIYSLMPIFHPDFLIINPNMKRTAWIDLQKVMERIGKI
jgi:uracil-DNA glycosylase family 4